MAKKKLEEQQPVPAKVILVHSYYRDQVRFYDLAMRLDAANPDLIAKMLEKRKPRVRPPGGMSIHEIQEEIAASLKEDSDREPQALVFQHAPDHPETRGVSNCIAR